MNTLKPTPLPDGSQITRMPDGRFLIEKITPLGEGMKAIKTMVAMIAMERIRKDGKDPYKISKKEAGKYIKEATLYLKSKLKPKES